MRVGVNSQVLAIGVRHGFSTYLSNILKALRSRYGEHQFLEWSCRTGPQWRMPNQLWWDQAQVPWHAFREKVDLLHVPAFSGPVLRTCPMVLTVHDLMYTKHPEWLPSQRARWYWGTWIPLTARLATAVITPSDYTKRDLVELAHVSPDRVHVIPEAIDQLFLTRLSGEQVRTSASRLVGEAPYLLYVGSVDRRKDWRTLLQAFALLRTRIPEVRLVIAGHIIQGRSHLHEHIQACQVTDAVICTGYVEDDELVGLYARASIFVYPSWFEGFGLPLLEAMAMGVPVISYRTSSIPEVVGDGAILIDPPFRCEDLANAMEQVLTNVSYRDTLVEKGSRWAKHFSWDRAAEETMAVYERCL
jgi:glycosyltransferase involved in cell wall biosynthesis